MVHAFLVALRHGKDESGNLQNSRKMRYKQRKTKTESPQCGQRKWMRKNFYTFSIFFLLLLFLLVGCATQRDEIRRLGEGDESGVPKLVKALSDIRVRWEAYLCIINKARAKG
jgi:hypothetical protein